MTRIGILPQTFPETGIGDDAATRMLLSLASDGAANLAAPDALAHMDPPAAPVASALWQQVAAANQNLLHPTTSPFASEAEALVLGWIAPAFGMAWGQMCSGSTIANLTALWAARAQGAVCVVASADAHISVPKAAHILGMDYVAVPVDGAGRLDRDQLPELTDAALVLTAGTTGRGVIDSLAPITARWLHVDAAWAGPLQFTRHAAQLDGIAVADSVAISAHKWLYQPKGAALALFRDESSRTAISFQSSYLARPNVGVEGSRGATAIPLLATLLAWGRQGLAGRIEASMALSEALAARLLADPRTVLKQAPETGVVNWRPVAGDVARIIDQLSGTSSSVMIDGETWVRQVAANPDADLEAIWARIDAAL
jgi:L-2,4-diaminobutyrate decarboxylase